MRFTGGGTALTPPDLSALELRFHPAYIHPVHETAVSGVGGITTFLRNIDFDDNYGKVLWDQARTARNLCPSVPECVSVPGYWTVMIVSAFQAEEPDDNDPHTEVGAGSGLTLGICTHGGVFGAVGTTSPIGSNYSGICAVFKAVLVGEAGFGGREQYTVAHEVGHTLGLDHSASGLMCETGDCQMDPFASVSLKKLREYNGP